MTDRQPVARALAVLEALNRKPLMALAEIAAAAGVPKPTAVRLLAELCAAGYAERVSRSAGVFSGVSPSARMKSIASSILRATSSKRG